MATPTVAVATPSDTEAQFTRRFNAPRARVFDAMTTSTDVRQWLLGQEGWTARACGIDLRPGGESHFAWLAPEGFEMRVTGTYVDVDRPRRIVHREMFDPDWTGGPTVVTTVLEEDGDATQLTLTVQFSSKEARDFALTIDMATSLNRGYARLDELLAASVIPD